MRTPLRRVLMERRVTANRAEAGLSATRSRSSLCQPDPRSDRCCSSTSVPPPSIPFQHTAGLRTSGRLLFGGSCCCDGLAAVLRACGPGAVGEGLERGRFSRLSASGEHGEPWTWKSRPICSGPAWRPTQSVRLSLRLGAPAVLQLRAEETITYSVGAAPHGLWQAGAGPLCMPSGLTPSVRRHDVQRGLLERLPPRPRPGQGPQPVAHGAKPRLAAGVELNESSTLPLLGLPSNPEPAGGAAAGAELQRGSRRRAKRSCSRSVGRCRLMSNADRLRPCDC